MIMNVASDLLNLLPEGSICRSCRHAFVMLSDRKEGDHLSATCLVSPMTDIAKGRVRACLSCDSIRHDETVHTESLPDAAGLMPRIGA